LPFVTVGQHHKAAHLVALVPFGLRQKFLNLASEVIPVAGHNHKLAFPRGPDDLGIRGMLWQADIGDGFGTLSWKVRSRLRNVSIKQEPIGEQAVFSLLARFSRTGTSVPSVLVFVTRS
jgi:hypothetical protein